MEKGGLEIRAGCDIGVLEVWETEDESELAKVNWSWLMKFNGRGK